MMPGRERDPEEIVNDVINQSEQGMDDLLDNTEVDEDAADVDFDDEPLSFDDSDLDFDPQDESGEDFE